MQAPLFKRNYFAHSHFFASKLSESWTLQLACRCTGFGFWILILSVGVLLSACSPVSKKKLNRTFKETEEKFQDLTGFVLYDPEKKKTLYGYNGNKYFTPASNTKIFTFYASLKTLGDSVPAIKYVEHGDSLIFWGMGDPSFLYKKVSTNDRIFSFLKNSPKQLFFSNSNFHTAHFGSGWAWDDYNDYYSSERSPFPVFGNTVSVQLVDRFVLINPPFFKTFFSPGEQKDNTTVLRQWNSNDFVFQPGKTIRDKKWEIPFRVDQRMIVDVLADTLKRTVEPISQHISLDAKTMYSIRTDSLYKIMMQESDNFVAEQLLMICAGILSDSLQPEIAIKRIQRDFLHDLKHRPIWVDGSGLSRYNLFTPESVVQVWEKIYELVPRERLFQLLAIGGKAGTIKNWYKGERPFIFGKTGTLSNNHSLSGYLVAKSGKILIFSFMNSNFTVSTNEVRRNMETTLMNIYENY